MMIAANILARLLPKRKPIKSGIVRESSISVNFRSRGATTIQAKNKRKTAKGII